MAAAEPRITESVIGADPTEQLLADLKPMLAATFYKFRIPPGDAEDLLQNALLALVCHRPTIRNEPAWLAVTVRRQCLLYWRQKRRRLYDAIDSTVLENLAPSTAPDQERHQLRRDLLTVIAQLSARCREVLRLRYGLECETNEVAARMGYKESSMHKITARCRAALALALGSPLPPGAKP